MLWLGLSSSRSWTTSALIAAKLAMIRCVHKNTDVQEESSSRTIFRERLMVTNFQWSKPNSSSLQTGKR